jgi:hypothetical protein
LGPKEPQLNEGLAMLRFVATGDIDNGLFYPAPVSKIDVTLINNVFLNNDYSFDDDTAVSSFVSDFSVASHLLRYAVRH